MRLDYMRAIPYIARMGKTNNSNGKTAGDTKDGKDYERHVCGECAKCTPETAFHTLTVKDRKPTMGRCPEEKYCVLLSQRACREFIAETKPPGSA